MAAAGSIGPASPAAFELLVRAGLAIARRAAMSVRSHSRLPCAHLCAVFVGTFNSKTCPQSYSSVQTDVACKSLAAIGSKSYGGSVNVTTLPPGCLWLTVDAGAAIDGAVGVYLNTHSIGAAHIKAQQLCVRGTAAPPSLAQPRAPGVQARRPAHSTPHTHNHATCDGCGLLRRQLRRPECDCGCRAECDGASAQPSRWYGRSARSTSLHGVWPGQCGNMCCAARICNMPRGAVRNFVQHSRIAAQTATAALKTIFGSRPRRRA